MFAGCASLVNAPAISGTTLANYCCAYMFYNCTSLVNAPALLATAYASNCYANMFRGCTNLSFIMTKMSSFSGCNSWVTGVASSGKFIYSNISSVSYGSSYCPSGWTAIKQWGFYVKAEEAGATVKMAKRGSPPAVTL